MRSGFSVQKDATVKPLLRLLSLLTGSIADDGERNRRFTTVQLSVWGVLLGGSAGLVIGRAADCDQCETREYWELLRCSEA